MELLRLPLKGISIKVFISIQVPVPVISATAIWGHSAKTLRTVCGAPTPCPTVVAFTWPLCLSRALIALLLFHDEHSRLLEGAYSNSKVTSMLSLCATHAAAAAAPESALYQLVTSARVGS